MRLRGWRQIAGYLNCRVGTAQRWTRDAGLPAKRIRKGPRALVMAHSEQLDDWLRQRPYLPQAAPVSIFDRVTQQQIDFLWTELRIGNEFVKLASISRNLEAIGRRRAGARKAYDVAFKMLASNTSLSEAVRDHLCSELRGLKRKLEEMGELFTQEPGA